MSHFGPYTRQGNQIFVGGGNFAVVLLIEDLRGLLDVFRLLVVEAHLGYPCVQVGCFSLHDCLDGKILLVDQVLRRSVRHFVLCLRGQHQTYEHVISLVVFGDLFLVYLVAAHRVHSGLFLLGVIDSFSSHGFNSLPDSKPVFWRFSGACASLAFFLRIIIVIILSFTFICFILYLNWLFSRFDFSFRSDRGLRAITNGARELGTGYFVDKRFLLHGNSVEQEYGGLLFFRRLYETLL